MAGWMIRLSERYLGPVYREMHRRILESKLIHCDETPFKVVNDRRSPNSKRYMWVYHSSARYGSPPIFLYEYQPTRKTDNPRKFLEGYSGILMTDGYQVYHTLAGERPDELKVQDAGHMPKGVGLNLLNPLEKEPPMDLLRMKPTVGFQPFIISITCIKRHLPRNDWITVRDP